MQKEHGGSVQANCQVVDLHSRLQRFFMFLSLALSSEVPRGWNGLIFSCMEEWLGLPSNEGDPWPQDRNAFDWLISDQGSGWFATAEIPI